MAQYIDKDALVAEINKLKNISLEYGYTTEQRIVANVGKDLTLKGLFDYIDTLEVKEVDLDKEVDDYINEHFSECDDGVLISDANSSELTLLDITPLAKHFFELGLKAQKGEEL